MNKIKIALMISYVLKQVFTFFEMYLSSTSVNRPMPENVKDVYDEKEYNRWKAYNNECKKVDLINAVVDSIVSFILTFFMLEKIFNMFDIIEYLKYLWYIFFTSIISIIISIPFEYYDTFVIEEKYGMNKSTRFTFVMDIIKSFIMDMIMTYGLLVIVKFLYDKFGNDGSILIIVSIVGIAIVFAACTMLLLKVFNKFTPLEDGELKEKLLELCSKYNVEVKKIVVKDASKRTTRANAFCTGFGKRKTISLDDNLINAYTVNQIVAVFAHEFGHAKYKHVLKTMPFAIIRIILTITIVLVLLNVKSVYEVFGFSNLNYIVAFLVMELIIWPVSILFELISNTMSRNFEYQADAFAAKEGYGQDLIDTLKKLSKDSLSNINPHPIIVVLEHSHPTLSKRIEAINKIKIKYETFSVEKVANDEIFSVEKVAKC